MRCVRGVAAAAILAAALNSFARSALAETAADGREALRLLLFANTDLWRHGGFSHGGAVWSPRGLDREGFALKVMLGGGLYRYISGALGNAEVEGRQLSATLLPGWRFIRGGVIVTVFAGIDFQHHHLSPNDPAAGLRGGNVGFRTGFEIWYEPTAATTVAADASVSTIGPSYSARLAAGWRPFGSYYLGPEVHAFGADDNYRQLRVGGHLTGLKTEQFEWSAGIGWASDSDHRSSIYGKLGLITRR
jgi:hypothetical protein